MSVQTLKAYVGRNVAIAVDGYDVSGHGNELKAKRDAAVIDATAFGDRFEYGLAGIQKSSIELKGHYTPGYTGIDGIIHQRFGQDPDINVAYGALGWGALNPLVMQPSVITKYDIDAKLKGAVEIDSVYTARGAVDDGYQLFDPNHPVSGTTPVLSNVLDDTDTTGETDAGCAAHVHVFGLAGTTPSLTVTIQGADTAGGTFADLVVFDAITAIGSQRLVLPKGTTIPACIQASAAITGTGAKFNALVGFSRSVVYL